MKKGLVSFCLSLVISFAAFANEDTDISPAGKAKALENRPFFGCVTFLNILNQNNRSIGKGTFDAHAPLSFEIATQSPYQVVAELTGWGAFGAAFNLKIQNGELSIFNGTGIGYVEFTQYFDAEGKLKLGDFSTAKENSKDGILNHFFCTPMRSLEDIK